MNTSNVRIGGCVGRRVQVQAEVLSHFTSETLKFFVEERFQTACKLTENTTSLGKVLDFDIDPCIALPKEYLDEAVARNLSDIVQQADRAGLLAA